MLLCHLDQDGQWVDNWQQTTLLWWQHDGVPAWYPCQAQLALECRAHPLLTHVVPWSCACHWARCLLAWRPPFAHCVPQLLGDVACWPVWPLHACLGPHPKTPVTSLLSAFFYQHKSLWLIGPGTTNPWCCEWVAGSLALNLEKLAMITKTRL